MVVARRRGLCGLVITAGALLSALLALPYAAHAATASMSGSTLVFTGEGLEDNDVTFESIVACIEGGPTFSDPFRPCTKYGERGLIVRDAGAPVTAGTGCSQDGPSAARCPDARAISASLGDGGDQLDAQATGSAPPSAPLTPYEPGASPATVNGGSGWDTLLGGRGPDTLDGGPDADDMQGRGGVDTADYSTGHTSEGPCFPPPCTGQPRGVHVSLDGQANDGNMDRDRDFGVLAAADNARPDIENVVGSVNGDTLIGDGDANTLTGLGGNDQLSGQAGDDSFPSGSAPDGADTLTGGEGADKVSYAERTNAVSVTIGVGADDGETGEGDNIGGTVESADGGKGTDTLTGDDGPNTLNGRGAGDTLNGGGGNDILDDQAQQCTGFFGGGQFCIDVSGSDVMNGGTGDDRLYGGAPRAPAVNPQPPDADTLNGGDGIDTVDYSNRGAFGEGVTAGIGGGPDGDSATSEGDQIDPSVENLVGGSAGDTLIGDGDANRLTGGGGADSLIGGDGDDAFDEGGSSNGGDTFNGEAGSDTVDYSARSANVIAGIGGGDNDGELSEHDTITAGTENIVGGSANDSLTGDDGPNRLDGNGGNDGMSGGGGDDRLRGGEGMDLLLGDAGQDDLDGENGPDTLRGGDEADRLDGGGGNDDNFGGAGTDTVDFSGRSAAVVVNLVNPTDDGRDGETDTYATDVERVLGGSGPDELSGGDGGEELDGGGGNDRLFGSAGPDRLVGAAGSDELNGGADGDDLQSRDGEVDSVACGDGATDTVTADATDTIDADCEQKDTGTAPGGGSPGSGSGTGTGTGTGTSGGGSPAAGDTTKPVLALALPGQRLGAVLKRGLKVKLSSNEPGSLKLRVSIARTLAKRLKLGSKTVVASLARSLGAGSTTLTLKFAARVRRAFSRQRSLKLTVATTVTDGAGLAAQAKKTFLLRR